MSPGASQPPPRAAVASTTAESADGDKPVSTSGYQGTSDASPPPKRQRDTSPGKAKDLSPAVLAALGRELKSACEADAPLRALRLILAGADADDASTIGLCRSKEQPSVLCEQLLLLHATPETKQQEAEGVTAALFVEGGRVVLGNQTALRGNSARRSLWRGSTVPYRTAACGAPPQPIDSAMTVFGLHPTHRSFSCCCRSFSALPSLAGFLLRLFSWRCRCHHRRHCHQHHCCA